MADVVSGLLTSAIVKIAVNKLSSTIEEQANLALNFGQDLEEMKDIMETMAALFEDAEKQSVKSKSVRLWLKRLKYAALDISDMMDDYHDDGAGSTAKLPGMLSCFTTARKKMVLAKKMKNMRDHLRRINEQCQRFSFTATSTGSQDQQCYDERETTSDVNEARIFGREAEKKEIVDMLSATHKKRGTFVLPIYGLGGMGKSTLAQLVYNDTQFKQYDHRVWVYVSEVFDLRKVGRTIISQLSKDGGHQNANTLELIQQWLNKLLPDKKILIILDDIWQEDASELDKLKHMLHVDKKGSMVDVLVTTRSESIAKEICTNEAYKLQPLMDNICWDIVKRYSEFEKKSNQEKLVEIGLEISQKCGGMALAAQALGYMLRAKDLDGWIELKNSDIWIDSPQSDGSPHSKVLPSLKLSYERMLPVLRLCFSYCAIFPKGHDMYENDLVHQWLALDFIKKPSEGKEYIKQLFGMSFFQHSKLPNISGSTVMRYTMHDLARSVAGDDLTVIDAAGKVKKCEQKYCRHALLMNYDGQTKFSNIFPNTVRALHFATSSKLAPHDGLFSVMKRVRVLDFSECSSILLPSTVDKLKELRCLISPKLQNGSLPEGIVELPKLQYLNLRESSLLSALPESIDKLSCLIYLGMSRCSGIIKVPESFGGLQSLVHLDMSKCSGITGLPNSLGKLSKLQHLDLFACSRVKEIPESLGDLNQLQHLNLSLCDSIERLPESIGKLNNLKYLDLRDCREITELPGSFQKLQNLVHLDLSGCRCAEGLPQALLGLTSPGHLNMESLPIDDSSLIDISVAPGSLANLKYLDISCMHHCSVDFIGNLTNLEHLVLTGNTKIKSLPDSIGNLKNLHTLDLSVCWDLRSLPESIGNLKKLHTLVLSCCSGLESVPDCISQIPSLKQVSIDGCPVEVIELINTKLHFSLTLPLFNVRSDPVNACSNLALLDGINVVELNICSLENVLSVEDARKANLLDKDKLSDLSLVWNSHCGYRFVDPEALLEQLVPPRGLKKLRLEHYIGKTFRGWFKNISCHLPNLVSIQLCLLKICNNLPPLGQLPNLEELELGHCDRLTEMGKDFCGGKGTFCRLLKLTLYDMKRLEQWSTTYSFEDGMEEFMFPVLEQVVIHGCPRLRLTPCPPVCRVFRVGRSNGVISSLEVLGSDNNGRLTSSTTSTTYMEIRCGGNCRSLNLFHHFTALKELEIHGCSNQLTCLPESMRHLKSLESLTLMGCDSISALPEWLGDLNSLKSLTIDECEGLETLKIKDRAELKRWWESERSRNKSSHTSAT